MDIYNSKIAKLAARLNGCKRYAITISATCTLYSCPESEVHPEWRRHEEIHKVQAQRLGWRYVPSILNQYAKYGYWDAPAEKEARGE